MYLNMDACNLPSITKIISDPGARARANDVVNQLLSAVADYEAKAAKAEAAGDAKKAAELREAADARRMWLSEAQKGLADFTTA